MEKEIKIDEMEDLADLNAELLSRDEIASKFDFSLYEEIPKVYNVFVETHVGTKIDLLKCAKNLSNIIYPYENTAHAIISIRKPKSTVNVHMNGKLTAIGLHSELHGKIVMRKCARKIQKVHPQAVFKTFRVTQQSATAKLSFSPNLEKIAEKAPEKTFFNSEINRSLSYNIGDFKFLVNRTGKIVCNSTNYNGLYKAFEDISKDLMGLQKDD